MSPAPTVRLRHALLAAVLVAPLAPATAQTMQTDATPVAGSLAVSASEAPASMTFDVRAETESGVDGCVGYVAPEAPDAVVEWSGGDLRIWGRAGFDATLLVVRPDGSWACNDDADGTAPAVEIDGAEAGRYVVWLGSFSPDPFDTEATLYAGTPPPPPVLDASAAPASGTIEVVGGFEAAQGAVEVAVEAGGPDAAASLDFRDVEAAPGFCSGYLDAARPTAAVDYTVGDGTGTLALGASSVDTDLVLVVQRPDGAVLCDDDTNGTDPMIVVTDPEAGVYTAWAGTFRAFGEPVPATLLVSETAPEYDYDGFDEEYIEEPFESTPYSEGTYHPLDLSLAPRTALALDGDRASVETAVTVALLNPVDGAACTGYLEDAPTVGLTLSGDGPIAVTAASDEDLVLLLQTPSGGWFCSDDADGLNPGVQIDAPEAGVYKVWAGTFSDLSEAVDVEVTAERGELVVSGGDFGSGPMMDAQSDGAYTGTAIRPGAPQLRLGAADLPTSVTVEAGGPVLNPVEGDVCAGFVSERPTAEIDAEGAVTVMATPDDGTDLTLVVRTADGGWLCSDDADGQDPRVSVPEAEGTVSVWVGTFSRRAVRTPATLSVTPDASGN